MTKTVAHHARRYLLASMAILFLLTGCQTQRGAGSVQRRDFNQLLDAVVRIDVRERAFEEGSEQIVTGVGSGVIISPDGDILTNAHVVGPQSVEILVTLASLERVRARFIGWDHWTDLAVIRLNMEEIRDRGGPISPARFGDSDSLYPGQTVYAVGTPNGLSRTVSRGIISNTNRYFEGVDGVRGYETGFFNTWLQTDAAINPGNSGGPLVAEDGKVVGINTRAYLGANNLGFAVPSTIARRVLDEILEDGRVTRSYSGVVFGAMQDLERFYAIGRNEGMLVASVDPGSPGQQAGIRAGDILLTMEGEPLDGRFPEQLPPIRDRIASRPIGSEIKFQVRRGKEVFPVEVATEELESRVGEEWAFDGWGLSVRKVSRAFAREQRLDDDSGFIVLGTRNGYPAREARLQRGDVIIKVNREPVGSLEDFKEIYRRSVEDPSPLLLEVARGRSVSLLVLRP